MINKRGATAFAGFLLAIMCLLLCVSVIGSALIKSSQINMNFKSSLENIYFVEDSINFYLSQGYTLQESIDLAKKFDSSLMINLREDKIEIIKGTTEKELFIVKYTFTPKNKNIYK